MALPMPLDPPVTTATRPAKLNPAKASPIFSLSNYFTRRHRRRYRTRNKHGGKLPD
jgi:hypothetical protein